ncbi:class I SAM-dependent methyltransferase [Candidatus Dojkabacteria bacterium]|jgi:hypothetical protein|nr:class I SAM-dependent methyltransferase [Candidatus Dojkabacteria bacterium]
MDEKFVIYTDDRKTMRREVDNVHQLLHYYRDVVDQKVTGWFYPLDIILAYTLLNSQTCYGDVCELGVAYGKSAIGLSLCKKERDNLYLYDCFTAEVTPEYSKDLVESYGDNSNIHWNICDLMKIKKEDIKFENDLRYLHIDACHLHSAVLNDLNNFSKFMGSSGIIVVDDYNDPEYPGINTAIAQFCLSNKGTYWTMFAIGQNKAYLCRIGLKEYYMNIIVNFFWKTFPDCGITMTQSIDGEILLLGSRSPMKHEVLLGIISGKVEMVYN